MSNIDQASKAVACPLCKATATMIFPRHHGYQAPDFFDIYDCANCETRFASPMSSGSPSLYNLIYTAGVSGPGYERYLRYQQEIRSSSDPLGFLSRREDVYWMVAEAISQIKDRLNRKSETLRLLEIGSGFGYLTYALHKRGYNIRGIDISSTAVHQAREKFGPLYDDQDLMSLPPDVDGSFDLLIATELIEHLDAPLVFLERAMRLLAPGGSLILTTPARELYPLDRAWHTDPPPVHLWWFSRTSLRHLAWRVGAHAKFIDSTPYYSRSQTPVLRATKSQYFNQRGEIVFRDTWVNNLARRLMRSIPSLTGVIGRTFIRQMRRQRHEQNLYDTSLSHCVVMTKPALV